MRLKMEVLGAILYCVWWSLAWAVERPFLASQFSGSRFLFAPPSSERLLVLTSLYFVCVALNGTKNDHLWNIHRDAIHEPSCPGIGKTKRVKSRQKQTESLTPARHSC